MVSLTLFQEPPFLSISVLTRKKLSFVKIQEMSTHFLKVRYSQVFKHKIKLKKFFLNLWFSECPFKDFD